MFVKSEVSTFASAINVSKFDVITVRHDDGNYKLSVYNVNVPLKGTESFTDIATFSGEQQALVALDSLMHAIANNEPCWSID